MPVSARGSAAAALNGAGRVAKALGADRVQCFTTSTGLALSGRSVGGAVQAESASALMRRRKITIAPPQAQRQIGRGAGAVL